MNAEWKSFPDAEGAAQACAAHILSLLESALAGSGAATLALSGGSTPAKMFAHMARATCDWSRVHVFFVDERCVPPEHADSNYRNAEEHLLRPARIPQRNVHRMQGELAPHQAAWQYEREIREVFQLSGGDVPHFDVIHLGIGADAHTASLFPGERLIEDRSGLVAAVTPSAAPQPRITLLPRVLLAARHTAVLVAGDDKAEALQKVFHSEYTPLEVPSQIVAHHARRSTWFLDQAAARLLRHG